MLFEGRVRLEEAVVYRATRIVEEHLDDAETLIDRFKEDAIALLARPQGFLRRQVLGASRPILALVFDSHTQLSSDTRRVRSIWLDVLRVEYRLGYSSQGSSSAASSR
jgi:hypothetical protein